MSRAALFLDRDGTVNIEAGYIRELKNLNLIPGVADVIRDFNQHQVPVILATNQAGPARGYYPESWVHALHERLISLLKVEGAHLDAIYYCPHLAEGVVPEYSFACDCRKPEPGMLLQAAQEHDIDLSRSYMIGDKATDIDVGKNAGTKTILLTSGYGQDVLDGNYQHKVQPDHVFASLAQAHEAVLKEWFFRL